MQSVTLTALQHDQELLHSYLQLDAAARRPRFAEFIGTLKGISQREGAHAAGAWAARAVSPLLDYSSLMKLRRFVPRDGADAASGRVVRLAILGGPTTIQLRQLIELFLAGEGIAAEIYEAEYGLFRQEILTPGSGLDNFGPEIVFLATGARDVTRLPPIDADSVAAQQFAETELADWMQLWETAQSRWNATLIQNNFEPSPERVFGHYTLRHPAARENYLIRLNAMLPEVAPAYVVLHDLYSLAAEAGAETWFDPRFYHEFKMPCGAECLPGYAHSVVSLLRSILGRSKKALALDLDNTLWGGVVGDVGPGGIKFGQGSGEGEAFLEFQRYAKELSQRGIVLAVCSKNDPEKAKEPFEKRADMVLRLSDISAFVANWNNKADNLRAIADRLELGLDSIVFVDDNPAERALVRRFVPQVAVPDLPEDPSGYIAAVARHRYFETTSFTREDSARARYYFENSRRKELAAGAPDLEAFLTSLRMKMKVEPINDLNIERSTQLINKSNQFNLTTRRYTLAEIRGIVDSPEWCTRTFSLRDELGDNGLISVILLRKQGDALAIDTWIMSCRVLQRGVEQFARNELVDLCRVEDSVRLLGTYIPTAKNSLVVDHYAKLGFSPAGSDGAETFWELRVDASATPLTHSIERDAPLA
ncbi:MAG TPA: HAD-IIIC family phosphatase [Planctomycetaceae bacterium]|jgi:FkbH-like protein|nr:HAD-IIIC family phosphatase [Planctomycetaceae bacterium]